MVLTPLVGVRNKLKGGDDSRPQGEKNELY